VSRSLLVVVVRLNCPVSEITFQFQPWFHAPSPATEP
jgi:hypothetical protein